MKRWVVVYQGLIDEGGGFSGQLGVSALDEHDARTKAEKKLQQMCEALGAQYGISKVYPDPLWDNREDS